MVVLTVCQVPHNRAPADGWAARAGVCRLARPWFVSDVSPLTGSSGELGSHPGTPRPPAQTLPGRERAAGRWVVSLSH